MAGEASRRHRILFIGQKPVGEAAWLRLRQAETAELEVVALCSNESAETVWWRSNAVFETRGDRRFVDAARRDDEAIRSAIDDLGVTLIVVVQYPWVLPPDVLERVDYNALVVHNARLPDYGGHNAVNHAILNGDATFACMALWAADEVDAGEIALTTEFAIDPAETALSLYGKAHHAALFLVDEIIRRLASGEELPRRRLEGDVRFHRRDSIEALRELESADPVEVDRKSRAFFFPPFEPAYVRIAGRKAYVLPESAVGDGAFRHHRDLLDEQIAAAERITETLAVGPA